MVRTHPGRDRVSIADLPVQALFRLADDSGNPRVTVGNELAYRIHVARLEPRFLDVFRVLVRDDPVELLTVPKRVLHEMYVLADPDVDAFLLYKLGRQWIALQVGAFEERSETCISR